MAKAISPKRIVSKPNKRPRRALVGKNPTRTGVRPRHGKVIPKPNLSKYKHNASSDVEGLSSGCDSKSQSDYSDKTPRTANLSSTRPFALDYARLTSPKTRKFKYSGTQNDPYIIESENASEVEDPPLPQLKANRARLASHFKHHAKEEPQERYSNQRKRGQSRYCPPTSRKPGVKDMQEFIEDIASDAESVETFHGTDTESEDEKSDLDEEEMAEELDELSITMDDWGENKKRQRSPNTDTDTGTETDADTDTDVDVCLQRNATTNNTKRNQAASSLSKRPSKKSRFEFSPEPMDDDDDFFALHAAKQKKSAVKSQMKPASRWAQKDRAAARNRPHAATSPSPTSSLLSLDFSLLNREVPIASVEPTDHEVRLQSRKSKSVVLGVGS